MMFLSSFDYGTSILKDNIALMASYTLELERTSKWIRESGLWGLAES